MTPHLFPLTVILVPLLLAVCAGVIALVLRRRAGQAPQEAPLVHPPTESADREELHHSLREVIRTVPRRPPLLTLFTDSPLSLLVEARLLAGCPSQALDEAEEEVLRNPQDGGGFVALAKALLYCNQEEEARAALRWAQRLGANDPEFDYLRARLGRADLEALRLCVRACRREPGYGEALYLCARLCQRLGFVAEGDQLLRHIAPLMHLSVERVAYRRDLGALCRPQQQTSPSSSSPSKGRIGPGRRLLQRLTQRGQTKEITPSL